MIEHHSGELSLTGAGNLSFKVEMLVDVWPDWLAIAIEAAEHAERCARDSATGRGELRASLQAAAAAAISVEAFHRLVRTHCLIRPPARGRRAPEVAAATMQVELRLTDEETGHLLATLNTLFDARDTAVHPAGHAQPPVYVVEHGTSRHPLDAQFTAHRAVDLVHLAIEVLHDLITRMPNAASPAVQDIDAARCAARLDEVLNASAARWTPGR